MPPMPPSQAFRKPVGSDGSDSRSRSSGPVIALSINAASRTVRVIGPAWTRTATGAGGYTATRPNDGFRPNIPQKEDGMRIEPAPSVPTASWPKPVATAAAAPPEEHPAFCLHPMGYASHQSAENRLLL